MGRKVFQDFAHVMCQKFVDSSSNRDHVILAIMGSGRLRMEILKGKATHNRLAISPLPFAAAWTDWVMGRMDSLHIPRAELMAATLVVEYTVDLYRHSAPAWLCARYDFKCYSEVGAQDRSYSVAFAAQRDWGLHGG